MSKTERVTKRVTKSTTVKKTDEKSGHKGPPLDNYSKVLERLRKGRP